MSSSKFDHLQKNDIIFFFWFKPFDEGIEQNFANLILMWTIQQHGLNPILSLVQVLPSFFSEVQYVASQLCYFTGWTKLYQKNLGKIIESRYGICGLRVQPSYCFPQKRKWKKCESYINKGHSSWSVCIISVKEILHIPLWILMRQTSELPVCVQ